MALFENSSEIKKRHYALNNQSYQHEAHTLKTRKITFIHDELKRDGNSICPQRKGKEKQMTRDDVTH